MAIKTSNLSTKQISMCGLVHSADVDGYCISFESGNEAHNQTHTS